MLNELIRLECDSCERVFVLQDVDDCISYEELEDLFCPFCSEPASGFIIQDKDFA